MSIINMVSMIEMTKEEEKGNFRHLKNTIKINRREKNLPKKSMMRLSFGMLILLTIPNLLFNSVISG